MVRLIHSADWQLGARFAQFGSAGRRLREARLETLSRVLKLADKHEVDAFLIAGDLFEDNQVDDALVRAVLDLFRTHLSLPIYILPGNHDPYSGPDSVWQRKAFLNAPANVHVLREPGVIDLSGSARIIAAPLRQKLSSHDPSLKLAELAASLPADAIKIGITHGALAIESKHQPNDFPIALNAATRAGLDYLAIGHWHNWLADTDGGKIMMPGTPEPDRFANDDSGHVALVEIDSPGQPARAQKLPVATLTWRAFTFDFLNPEASRTSLTAFLAELAPAADRTVLRVTLSGTASPTALYETRTWLDAALSPFLVGQVSDETRVALTAAELADLRARHPILAQVLADIDRLEGFAGGHVAASPVPPGDSATQPPANSTPPLTLAEAQSLLAPAKIDLTQLTPAWFAQLRQTVLQSLQEVTS